MWGHPFGCEGCPRGPQSWDILHWAVVWGDPKVLHRTRLHPWGRFVAGWKAQLWISNQGHASNWFNWFRFGYR